MNIRRTASGIAATATLLSALVATVAAPLASASVTVTSAGSVPLGQTSAATASFVLRENSLACFGNPPNAYGASGGYIRIRILDSAGGTTVHFVSPTVTAPGSLNASVSVQGANSNVLEVLFNGATAHDDANFEQATASAKISADAGAPTGAIQAALISGGPAGFTGQRACVLPTTTTATGQLLNPELIGSTAIQITNVGVCDFQVTGGGNGQLVFGAGGPAESININVAPASAAGVQTVTSDPLATGHPSGQQVSQTVTTASCGLGNIALGSPGTVAAFAPVLAFIAGPGAPLAGQPFPTNVQVAIQNGGVTQTSGISATVTLAIGTNPAGGILTCTGGTAVGTVAGVATFTGCSIDKAGVGYTLTATASNVVPPGAIAPATSAPFNVGTPTATAVMTLTTSCSPTPCPLDTSKSPPQANIKLPQSLNEGVTLVAHIGAGGGNRAILFEVSKDNISFSSINGTATDAAGNATFFYRPSDNRYYRVTFAGAPDLGAAASPVIRIVVRSLIFLRPTGCTSTSPCRISQNDEVLFTVTARPNRPELPLQFATFTVQRKVGSTWVAAGIDQLVVPVSKSSGNALFNVVFNVRGTWRLRVNLNPTTVNANSFPTAYEYYSVS